MGWAEYKLLCDRPDYQSFWMIQQTLDLLERNGEEALYEKLSSVLKGKPLAFPPGHKAPPESVMYSLVLDKKDRMQIYMVVTCEKNRLLLTSSPGLRRLTGFEEVWRECGEYDG